MARKESGTVRPTKRKRVFFAAAVLLLVCVLAAGAVSADTVTVDDYTQLSENISNAQNDLTIIIAANISVGANQGFTVTKNITLTTTADTNHRIYRIAANTSYDNGMFTIQGNGKLTIQGNNSQTFTHTLTLDGNKTAFENNNQTLVWVAQGGNFTLKDGGVLTNNEAKNSGGAVHVIMGTFTMSGGTITGNNATTERQGRSGNGGGVYIEGGTFTMSDGKISKNTAIHGNGGGVYVKDGTFTMSGGEISSNTAEIDSSTTALTGGGGGVYIENGTFTMSSSANIWNNTAYYGGGAFMKDPYSKFTMSGNTKISQNVAKNRDNHAALHPGRGGGVHIDAGTFVMSDNAIISQNEAEDDGGGVYVHYSGNFTMKDGSINNNTASGNGGGVLIADSGTITMNSGKISNNTAGKNGGGVYLLSKSTFTMKDGEISNNTAGSGNGGGVDLRTSSTFTMSGGTITGNAAKGTGPGSNTGAGGGVGITSGTFTMSGGEITGNEADTNGTSVYVGDIFNIQDSGTVNGVYLPNGKNITVTDELNAATMVTGIVPANPAQDLLVVDLDKASDENYLSMFELDDSVKNFALKYQTSPTAGLVLTPTHTVSFLAYDGTPAPDEETVNHGDTVTRPIEPAKDGHTFAGWHEDASFITLWNFNTPVTKDLTLHAKWIPNEPGPEPPSGGGSSDGNMENAYRVLFNDGATTLYVVTDLSAGDKLTKPEDPVKDGYTFAGWHKDSACTQAWDFNDGITGSMTLYAKWTPQETVTPTATATATPTGDASPAQTSQPDNEGNSNGNGETTTTPGISLPYLIGGILILLLAILLLLILLLRHTVTFLIPTGGELEEYRIKVWHGKYINTEDLPHLIRTAAWYRDTERQERWDFDQDRVKKSIELYLG